MDPVGLGLDTTATLIAFVGAALLSAGALWLGLREARRVDRLLPSDAPPTFPQPFPQDRSQEEVERLEELERDEMTPYVSAFQRALEVDRRKSFWPSIWVAIVINFVTNTIFFVLGIVLTQHR